MEEGRALYWYDEQGNRHECADSLSGNWGA